MPTGSGLGSYRVRVRHARRGQLAVNDRQLRTEAVRLRRLSLHASVGVLPPLVSKLDLILNPDDILPRLCELGLRL